MTTPAGHAGRNLTEIKLDLNYAACVAGLHAVLYGRLHKVMRFINALSATAVITALVKQSPFVASASSILIAVLSVVDLVYDFGAASEAHRQDRKRFLAILEKANNPKVSPQRIDAEYQAARAAAAEVLKGLSMPAHISNLRTHGYDVSGKRLTRWEQVLSFFT